MVGAGAALESAGFRRGWMMLMIRVWRVPRRSRLTSRLGAGVWLSGPASGGGEPIGRSSGPLAPPGALGFSGVPAGRWPSIRLSSDISGPTPHKETRRAGAPSGRESTTLTAAGDGPKGALSGYRTGLDRVDAAGGR